MKEGGVDAQAAAWFARVRAVGQARADAEGLSSWLADPVHARAYGRIEHMWNASARLADDADVRQATAQALQARSGFGAKPSRAWLSLALAACALIVVIMIGPTFFTKNSSRDAFVQTYRAEDTPSNSLALPDGSTLRLNVASQVRVAFEENRRELTIDAGEAMFTVHSDRQRPFVVHAGDTRVEATGTQFGVRVFDDRIGVALVEGSVVVSRAGGASVHETLSPGQYLEVSAAGSTRRTISPAAALAWTEGKLVFEAVPLAAAIAEFNRYTTQDIQFDVAIAGNTPITGVFDIDDPSSFIAALNAMLPATTGTTSEGTPRPRPE